ncbi:RagB/SusD family nutrient uptake outer membrane protein [Flavivirga sp. 57AJ16]|uniref:RagB/SusD family nutrient uptake outer membrane protein n=1 Tax=Flavivirga sp. 57AJ16 TaxID=3025307 RepID=UPI0023656F4A|nr:RagB/SusD family nutrient uptake outer membrane protein [Flavivirga sp. 57AJ16]MDD7887934.1 RagB/SusD family nutrient uptake outer membrane protein [Flavivirga sp. 57AJ16]
MNTNKFKIIILVFSICFWYSCDIEDGQDLNGPQTSSISEGLSRPELPQVVSGILADMRDRLHTQIDAISVLGRDYWRHQSSDPRWVGDLMTGTLDDNAFYLTTPYSARYAVVKECNLLLEGLENTTETFTDAEKAAIRGFANTIKAHELLSVLMMLYQNGIRTDVADPDNLGAFESFDGALTTIIGLLNTAATDLTTGGGNVSPNTLGLETMPISYLEFNRAITARAAAYQGDYTLVLTALADSFMDINAPMSLGAYYKFSSAGGDALNQLFFALNSTGANARIAHPDFVNSAEAGDTRVNKAVFREVEDEDTMVLEPNPLNIADLTPGTHDVWVYQSSTDPVGMIRNEELLLLYAEANMVSNPSEAEAAIDAVRDAAGLGPIGAGNVDEDQLLYERRYSLFAEGHRWIDMRRFDRLDELVIDRAGDNIVTQFPIPQNEGQ